MSTNKMTAIDLAEYLTDWNVIKANPFSKDVGKKSAAMLRRQHEAIVKLRDALDHAKDYAPIDGYAFEAAVKALKDTEL